VPERPLGPSDGIIALHFSPAGRKPGGENPFNVSGGLDVFSFRD